VIAATIDTAFVFAGRAAPEHRVWAMPQGTAPPGLPPAATLVMPEPVAFDPADQARAVPLTGSFDWSRATARRAVTPFLSGREAWPRFSEFQAAGLGLAYANLRRHAAISTWAIGFDIPYATRRDAMTAWSTERVRRELPGALEGWDRWPTEHEFWVMGHGALRQAAVVFGSPQQWAAECGAALSPRQRRRWDRWTAERIDEALAELWCGRTTWPDPFKAEFEAAAGGAPDQSTPRGPHASRRPYLCRRRVPP